MAIDLIITTLTINFYIQLLETKTQVLLTSLIEASSLHSIVRLSLGVFTVIVIFLGASWPSAILFLDDLKLKSLPVLLTFFV